MREIDQLAMRFKNRYGRFGILTYRKDEEKRLLKSCRDCLDENYILCLNDNDIISLLKQHIDNGEVDDFMENKIQQLILS